jgi:hypothetical protein
MDFIIEITGEQWMTLELKRMPCKQILYAFTVTSLLPLFFDGCLPEYVCNPSNNEHQSI